MNFQHLSKWAKAIAVVLLVISSLSSLVLSGKLPKPIITNGDNSKSTTVVNPKPPTDCETRTIGAIVQDKSNRTPLPGVEVTVTTSGPPKQILTSSTGYFEIIICKDTKRMIIDLRKDGYQTEIYDLNLGVDPNIPTIFYMKPNEVTTPTTPGNTTLKSSPVYIPKVFLRTNKQVYAEAEPIEVEYSGFPTKYINEILLIRSKSGERLSDSNIVKEQGLIEFDGLLVGDYELRAYYQYRPGSEYKILVGQHSFQVKK